MAFKFVALFALIAAANAGVLAPVATYAAAPVLAKTVVSADFDPNPQYSYAYSVADAITGDNKHQQESRNGDVVSGSYSLVEADGTRRVVEYTADDVNGFNAVVRKEGTPVVTKTVVAAPIIAKVAAPAYAYQAAPAVYHAAPALTHYAAPVARVAYSAPTVHSVHAAPAVYHSAPAVYHSAPAVYHAAPAVAHYAAAPAIVKTHFASPYASYVH